MAPLGRAIGLRMHTFYGGVALEPQIAAAERGVDVVIACPGRLLDLIERGHLSLSAVRIVVVDEADRMADMGFLPDVRRLLEMTPTDRQTLLFSATLDGDVDVLVREYQRDPVLHLLHGSATADDDVTDAAMPPSGHAPVPSVQHHLWSVRDDERTELTAAIIEHCGSTLVFVRTRHGADRLATRLRTHRITAMAMHGGNSQIKRDQALDDFRAGRLQALVATDVAARGVHVDDVACVVQYDLPVDPKDYVHRAGRTGRAGASGAVVSLVPPAMRGRALMVAGAAGLGDVSVERADLEALESADRRELIDRELAALDQLKRPGRVGSVAFDQPRIEKAVAGAAGR
jgi:superfamily II DNA/RNA helicase